MNNLHYLHNLHNLNMFDAAKDFVFTNSADGKTITSGGYRISKILGTTKKNKEGVEKKKKEMKKKLKTFIMKNLEFRWVYCILVRNFL